MEKEILAASGFDLNWLIQMEQKYGAMIFGIIGDFLNQGFSAAWIIGVVDKVHPLLMDVLYKVFSLPALASAKVGLASGVLDSLNGASVDEAIKGELGVFLIEKLIEMLPTLGLSGWKLSLAAAGLNVLLNLLKK